MGGNSLARILKPARLRAGSNGFEISECYVPASLDEILSLAQCASWFQLPEEVLREMIVKGTLKPLPLPGADYRTACPKCARSNGHLCYGFGKYSGLSSTADPEDVRHHRSKAGVLLFRPATEPRFDGVECQNGAGSLSGNEPPSAAAKRKKPSPPRRSEPEEKVTRRTYESHGRTVDVTYRLGASPRHRLAESNLLDVVVNSIKAQAH